MSSDMLKGLGVAAMGGAVAYATMGPLTAFNVFTGIVLNLPKSRGPNPFELNTHDVARKIFSYGVVVPAVSALAVTVTNHFNRTSIACDDLWQGPVFGALATLGVQYYQNRPNLQQASVIFHELPDAGRQMIAASTTLARESVNLFSSFKSK